MITISKIPDGKNWADAIAQYRSKGMRTNFYAAAEEFLPQLQWLSELKFDGGCYLFHEKEKQIDLYFFLEQGRKAEQIPVFDKPVLLEQVGVTKAPPDLAEWEEIGFARYLQRKRLFLSARNLEKTERVPSFAKEEETETILTLMQQSFEPYTSALPDLDTLRQDIRENRVLAAREGEKLLGFLRFGREKKVSVLWQIAVVPDGRGKGIGSGLVQDWLVIERDEAAKFQLWVREDNPSALRMYEASGFLPDGRIAPVMMKK